MGAVDASTGFFGVVVVAIVVNVVQGDRIALRTRMNRAHMCSKRLSAAKGHLPGAGNTTREAYAMVRWKQLEHEVDNLDDDLMQQQQQGRRNKSNLRTACAGHTLPFFVVTIIRHRRQKALVSYSTVARSAPPATHARVVIVACYYCRRPFCAFVCSCVWQCLHSSLAHGGTCRGAIIHHHF